MLLLVGWRLLFRAFQTLLQLTGPTLAAPKILRFVW